MFIFYPKIAIILIKIICELQLPPQKANCMLQDLKSMDKNSTV